jgi:hypothetical protein
LADRKSFFGDPAGRKTLSDSHMDGERHSCLQV